MKTPGMSTTRSSHSPYRRKVERTRAWPAVRARVGTRDGVRARVRITFGVGVGSRVNPTLALALTRKVERTRAWPAEYLSGQLAVPCATLGPSTVSPRACRVRFGVGLGFG